jgi:hypothetical protein
VRTEIRVPSLVFISFVFCLPVVAGDRDLLEALATGDVESLRINLNPWGPHLGFEIEIGGEDPGVAAMVSVISDAEFSQGHKCANRGSIRFRMTGGEVIAVGLLPGHIEGSYQLRLCDGAHLEGVYSLQRAALLGVLEGLGVPVDDPAFGD